MKPGHDELARLTGWGRTAPTSAHVVRTTDIDAIATVVAEAGERGVIARGLGRSYGDPSQNAGGVVVDMTALDRVHRVDADAGTVEVDAGVSLDTLMRTLLPFGLWLPVLPGTRQVTVGGAIGSDIHGKAHHVEGSFGNHVRSMDLLTADGTVHTLTPDGPEAELFWATTGGMGLTGIVLRATLHLNRVTTAYFLVDTDQVGNLDELMARQTEDDESYVESVSWFDVVTTGRHLGRGLLTRANHATVADLPEKLRRHPLRFDAPQLLTLPDVFPPGMLNRLTGKVFSELWYRKSPDAAAPGAEHHPVPAPAGHVRRVEPGLRPARVPAVPVRRAVRRRGRHPRDRAALRQAGHVSVLNVLKRFGAANPAPLSFPMPGWTLCLDFPIRPGLHELCDELDELVLAAGGRHYLAKESRARPEAIERGYPRLDEWRKVRAAVDPQGVFASDMSRRLRLA